MTKHFSTLRGYQTLPKKMNACLSQVIISKMISGQSSIKISRSDTSIDFCETLMNSQMGNIQSNGVMIILH